MGAVRSLRTASPAPPAFLGNLRASLVARGIQNAVVRHDTALLDWMQDRAGDQGEVAFGTSPPWTERHPQARRGRGCAQGPRPVLP